MPETRDAPAASMIVKVRVPNSSALAKHLQSLPPGQRAGYVLLQAVAAHGNSWPTGTGSLALPSQPMAATQPPARRRRSARSAPPQPTGVIPMSMVSAFANLTDPSKDS